MERVEVQLDIPDPQELILRAYLAALAEASGWMNLDEAGSNGSNELACQALAETRFISHQGLAWVRYRNGCGDHIRLSDPRPNRERLLVVFNHESARSPWGQPGGRPAGKILDWLTFEEREAVLAADDRLHSRGLSLDSPLSVTSVYRLLPDGRAVTGALSAHQEGEEDDLPPCFPPPPEPDQPELYALYQLLSQPRLIPHPEFLRLCERLCGEGEPSTRRAFAYSAAALALRCSLLPLSPL